MPPSCAAAHPRFVLFAARGTSDHAALYAKYLVELRLGLPAGLASPSTMTAYGARPDLRDVLLVAVSQSGGSPDLVRDRVRRPRVRRDRARGHQRARVRARPGRAPAHPCARRASRRAVAATKSYTAELLALLASRRRVGRRRTARRRAQFPDVVAARLQLLPQVEQLARRICAADRLVLTGRGYAYPTAREGALKLMETSYVGAHAFSGADLLHGPLAMVDDGLPVLAVVPDGVGATAMRPVLERLRERGADLTVLGGPASMDNGGAGLRLAAGAARGAGTRGRHRAAAAAGAADGHRCVAFDPDTPRGLSKVTRTW